MLKVINIPYVHYQLWIENDGLNLWTSQSCLTKIYLYETQPTTTLTGVQGMEAGLCQVNATPTPICYQGYHEG